MKLKSNWSTALLGLMACAGVCVAQGPPETKISNPDSSEAPLSSARSAGMGSLRATLHSYDPRPREEFETSAAISSDAWTQPQKIVASDHASGDRFGESIAISGDSLAIGAIRDDVQGVDSGSAYIYTRSGLGWDFQGKLVADDADAASYFGNAIALHGDTCIVGAKDDFTFGFFSAGSAHVFRRSGSAWTQEAKFTAPDPANQDEFGTAVAIQGDTAIVGVPRDDDTIQGSGSAYVFVRQGGVWTQQAKLVSPFPVAFANFGVSVSLDGDTAVVGANLDNFEGRASGSAYVFVRSGTTWTYQAKIKAASDGMNDHFGRSVSLSGDTVAIGSHGDDDVASNGGAVYIYVRSAGTWTEQAKLLASDGKSTDAFGESLSLVGDTVVIGASAFQIVTPVPGAVYVFLRNGTTWTQSLKFRASDAAPGDRFGDRVTTDGTIIAVGAPEKDDPEIDSGAVLTYQILHTLDFVTDGTPGASLTGNTSQAIFHGEFASPVTANPPGGTPFGYWSNAGALYSVANPLTVAGVKRSATYTAVFSPVAEVGAWEFYE